MTTEDESTYTRLQRPLDGYEQLRHPLPEIPSEPDYLGTQGETEPDGYEEIQDSRRRSSSVDSETYAGQVEVFDYSDSIPSRREDGDNDPYDGQVEVVDYPETLPTHRIAGIESSK